MSARDAYVEKLKAQFDQWNDQIDDLETRLRKASTEARSQIESQMAILRARRDETRARLEELRRASEDAWGDLRAGLEKARDDLAEALRTAASRLR
ncbi:MAG: hypothetical protein GC201_01860 [Alphaproteobacteria bacterium]|nr:hypothetical protein [Alphaproteobacteria bacterium]